jgi:hypothetical protein
MLLKDVVIVMVACKESASPYTLRILKMGEKNRWEGENEVSVKCGRYIRVSMIIQHYPCQVKLPECRVAMDASTIIL